MPDPSAEDREAWDESDGRFAHRARDQLLGSASSSSSPPVVPAIPFESWEQRLTGSETLVLELASGSGRFSQQFSRDQIKAVPVDRTRSNFPREVPTFVGDLTEERVQEYLWDLVRTGRVVHVHMSCPGTSFDRHRGAK